MDRRSPTGPSQAPTWSAGRRTGAAPSVLLPAPLPAALLPHPRLPPHRLLPPLPPTGGTPSGAVRPGLPPDPPLWPGSRLRHLDRPPALRRRPATSGLRGAEGGRHHGGRAPLAGRRRGRPGPALASLGALLRPPRSL